MDQKLCDTVWLTTFSGNRKTDGALVTKVIESIGYTQPEAIRSALIKAENILNEPRMMEVPKRKPKPALNIQRGFTGPKIPQRKKHV